MHDFNHRLIVWQQKHGRHDLPWQVSELYPDLAFRDHVAADPGGNGDSLLPAFPWRVFPMSPAWPKPLRMMSWPCGAVSVTTPGRATCMRRHGVSSSGMPAHFRVTSRRSWPCPGSVVRRRRPSPCLPSASVTPFSTATSNGCCAAVSGIDGWPGEAAVEQRLWALAKSVLPNHDLIAYTQGLMDLGATLCRPPPGLSGMSIYRGLPGSSPDANRCRRPGRARRSRKRRRACWCCCMPARCCWRSGQRVVFGVACGACPRAIPPPTSWRWRGVWG